MGGGEFWIDWVVPAIGVTAQGAASGMDIRFFVLGLICAPLFFASILLLYKEWKSRKKQKSKENYDLHNLMIS